MRNYKIAEELNNKCQEEISKCVSRLEQLDSNLDGLETEMRRLVWREQWQELQSLLRKVEKLQERMIQPYHNEFLYTDVHPYEVVEVRTDKMIVVKRMKATRNPSWKPETIVGGFAGHTVNNYSQEWVIESDEEATPIKVRWHESKGRWGIGKYRKFIGSSEPRNFYDFNF